MMMLRPAIVGSLMLVALVGCGGSAPTKSTTATGGGGGEAAGAKEYTLTADELMEDFKKDQQGAYRKYPGATVTLSGVAKTVGGGSQAGTGSVALATKDDPIGISCETVDGEPWAKVVPGQKVKLKGKWGPTAGGRPTLMECELVEVGESPAVTITAEKLAEEAAADSDGVVAKYKDKSLFVSGEVAKKEKDDGGAPTLHLKGNEKMRIHCIFNPYVGKPDGVNTGQKIQLVGRILTIGQDFVGLESCKLIKQAK